MKPHEPHFHEMFALTYSCKSLKPADITIERDILKILLVLI